MEPQWMWYVPSWRCMSASFEVFCLASGIEALSEMMAEDAQASDVGQFASYLQRTESPAPCCPIGAMYAKDCFFADAIESVSGWDGSVRDSASLGA